MTNRRLLWRCFVLYLPQKQSSTNWLLNQLAIQCNKSTQFLVIPQLILTSQDKITFQTQKYIIIYLLIRQIILFFNPVIILNDEYDEQNKNTTKPVQYVANTTILKCYSKPEEAIGCLTSSLWNANKLSAWDRKKRRETTLEQHWCRNGVQWYRSKYIGTLLCKLLLTKLLICKLSLSSWTGDCYNGAYVK